MAETATPEVTPGTIETTEEKPKSNLEPGYLVVCWNDPVNYMDYVTHVFQVVFGWARKKAEFHMLQVHEQGKSILKRDSMPLPYASRWISERCGVHALPLS